MARRVVALGPGSPDAVPALALEELVRVGSADVRCDAELCALLAERGVAHDPTAALIAAVDRDAWLLARSEPALETIPERPELAARAAAQSLAALWGITVRLRADCPWDREQTPATIVPHTIEEAYEVADAALAGPPGPKLVDELGDLLFQSFILALMAAEAGAGDLGDVADGIADKLVRRHPHVFGDLDLGTSEAVLRSWEGIKREQEGREGVFHDIPQTLPPLLAALKTQRRAAAVGFDWAQWGGAEESLRAELDELAEALTTHPPAGPEPAAAVRDEAGDVLFAAVNLLRLARVDPETALRGATARFRARVEEAERIAAGDGADWKTLSLEEQERYYRAAKDRLAGRSTDEGAR
ncbi:MAG: nucleoside triphosphate pyrophosphohydrolase [Gaiellales bacterium]